MKKLYILIAFIITEAIVFLLINISYHKSVEQVLQNTSKNVSKQYNVVNNSFKTLANTSFNGYIDKQEVIENFRNRDRESLYVNLKPSYNYLKSINFEQVHFHLPDNKSFLRMHKPQKYGDDLTDIRYSVDYVNRNKKVITGLEMGKVVPGFRFVYPMFDSNKHIGSVEASFSVYAFANLMEDIYNVHTHFLIDSNILNEKVFKEDKSKYLQSTEHEKYMMLKRKAKDNERVEKKYLSNLYKNEFKNIKNIVNSSIINKDLFSIDLEFLEDENKQHTHKIVTFLPLKNIQKQHIGYFVVYHEGKELKELETTLLKRYIIFGFIILLIYILIYKELNSKDILAQQVKEKTSELQKMAVEAEEYAQEVEELNNFLEDRIKVEVEKNAEQERKLANQSKQAALGDMIGNIAHQWRQPLSYISTAASGIRISKEMGILEEKDLLNFTDGIMENANYLSQTIDDFRDFIKAEKKLEEFDVSNIVDKSLLIVNSSINNHKLHIIKNFEEGIKICNYANELQQVVINIFNNAKDALKEKVPQEKDRLIFIDVYKDEVNVYISVKDTAGGIPDSIIDRIFEPYFTTKHQSQGTGLGLYMTHQIVCESMNGIVDIENKSFEYQNQSYAGAQFTIGLKLK